MTAKQISKQTSLRRKRNNEIAIASYKDIVFPINKNINKEVPINSILTSNERAAISEKLLRINIKVKKIPARTKICFKNEIVYKNIKSAHVSLSQIQAVIRYCEDRYKAKPYVFNMGMIEYYIAIYNKVVMHLK